MVRYEVSPHLSKGLFDNTGISIVNKKLGSLKVYKVSDFMENGKPLELSGAKFKLYKAADDAVQSNPPADLGTSIEGERVTYTDGTKVWEDLVPGKYWLEETKPPANHSLMNPNPLLITVEPGQTESKAVTVEDKATKGKLAIKRWYPARRKQLLQAQYLILWRKYPRVNL